MNEAVVIPIIIDPKAGVAGLKAVGEQAQKTNTELGGSTAGATKFGDSMKKTAGNALQLFGAMNLIQGATKILVEGLLLAFKGNEKLASSTKMLEEIQRKATASTREEVIQLQTLYEVAKDTTLSYGQRQAAIDKMNKAYPELHKNLSLENIGTQRVADAIQNVITNLVKKAQLQGTIAQIAELSNELDDAKVAMEGLDRAFLRNKIQSKVIDPLIDRIKTLTDRAIELQGVNVANPFSKLGGMVGDFKEVKVPKIAVKTDKVEIEPKQFQFKYLGATATDSLTKNLPSISTGLGQYIQDQLDEAARTKKYDLGIDRAATEGIDFSAQVKKGNDAYDALMEKGYMISDQVTNVLGPAFSNVFDAILEKKNAMQAFFDSIKQSIVQLIKQLVTAAIQAMVLKLITGGASSLSNAAKAMAGTGIIFPFATGGLVTGPVSAVVGEGMGTSSRNPEVVAPLDKLKSFFSDMLVGNRGFNAGNMGTAGAVVSMPQEVKLRMNGRDLVGSFQLEILSQKRTG